MAEIDPNAKPLVWEAHDIRFTVDPYEGNPVITLLGAHTDVQLILAQRATKAVLDSSRFVPFIDAGFEWMAYAIRLAWSEARVVVLEEEAAPLRAREQRSTEQEAMWREAAGEAQESASRLGKENEDLTDSVVKLEGELRILQLKYDSALADVARDAADQSGEACENCGSSDCEPTEPDKSVEGGS